MRHYLCTVTFGVMVLLLLAACEAPPTTTAEQARMLAATPALAAADVSCEACAQATLAAAQTQEKNNANNQAAGTAEIVRANAQATLNSANTTLSAAQTQDQNNANVLAAQIAGTAEIVRANAQATLNSAGATQVAAQTQSQYNLQGTNVAGTQSADAMITQQSKNDLAAGTQTAVANNIATQTQAAAATSQWYADQTRQREEQRQGPITFLWMWCLPIFIVLLAGFLIWGFWRWLRIQQANQQILEKTADKLPPPVEFENHRHALPYLESEIVENVSQLTTPDNEVNDWLDDVKNTLLKNEEKDEDENPDN
ncbi:MAG: hypothetical protein JNM02_09970 [Anaerolineales bacterium]|nr:hypothetical protein [Anaerolineales bacterium]